MLTVPHEITSSFRKHNCRFYRPSRRRGDVLWIHSSLPSDDYNLRARTPAPEGCVGVERNSVATDRPSSLIPVVIHSLRSSGWLAAARADCYNEGDTVAYSH